MCPLLGTWPSTQACALTGNQTGNLLICRPVLSPLSHTSQVQQWFSSLENLRFVLSDAVYLFLFKGPTVILNYWFLSMCKIWDRFWVPVQAENSFFSLRYFKIYFREGEKRDKKRERNINVRNINWLSLEDAPIKDWTPNPGTCLNWESNW